MKNLLCILAAMLLIQGNISADEGLKEVQTTLKAQGFYFGEADGKENAETTAAIRRFQIRNGLEVTGKLNAATLDALGTDKANPTPATPPQVSPAVPATSSPPAAQPPPAPAVTTKPAQPAPTKTQEQPKPANTAAKAVRLRLSPKVAETDPEEYTTFFHATPYATAPKQVQAETVRRAQDILVQGNFLRGAVGGVPDGSTADAIFAYQTEHQLTRTGRLDKATLASIGLLPQVQPSKAPLKPFYETFKREQ